MESPDGSAALLRDFKRDDFEADWIKLGEGKFSQVYQVKFKLWREQCALKTITTRSGSNNCYRKITDEVANIAKLQFKYVLSIYGVCSDATGVVMEYMSNGSLNNLLTSHTFMWQKKFQMIHEVTMGMNFLHSMKPPLLHLNLKTSNILLDDHLHVKISDFGIIHWEEGMGASVFRESLTARGNINYIPPETFTQCPDPPGIAFDGYSFGIVMWEILTQLKPYPGWNVTTVILQVSKGKRPSLELLPDERPQECEDLIDVMKQCWSNEPVKRPPFSGILRTTESLIKAWNIPPSQKPISDFPSLLFPLRKVSFPEMSDTTKASAKPTGSTGSCLVLVLMMTGHCVIMISLRS